MVQLARRLLHHINNTDSPWALPRAATGTTPV